MSENYAEFKDVARIQREFYRAFERLDLGAMRAVWLDDDRIKCIHPGGEMLAGRTRVHASWEAIFTSTTWIRFEIVDLSIEVFGELAWATNLERIHSGPGEGPQGGETLIAEAVATNLYVRRDGEWRMILHHASPLARRFAQD